MNFFEKYMGAFLTLWKTRLLISLAVGWLIADIYLGGTNEPFGDRVLKILVWSAIVFAISPIFFLL